MRIAPRLLPRDALDLMYGLMSLIVGGLIPIASFGMAFLTTNSFDISFYYMVAGWLALVAYQLCFTVRGLEINEEGIRFQRWFGYPHCLSWGKIISIRPANRTEVLKQGWLHFPFREETSCMTSHGHYKIEWQEDFRFFPPRDVGQFERAVELYGELKILNSVML